MRAWWAGKVANFLHTDPNAVVAQLAVRLVETHPLNRASQLRAWWTQTELLRAALTPLQEAASWHLLLEYPLLRLGRRIDAVLLTPHAVLVLEFKVGAAAIGIAEREQVDDYALDLLDFHAGSRLHPIVPILVATAAAVPAIDWPLLWHGVVGVLPASAATLPDLLRELAGRIPPAALPLDISGWEAAPYQPVPTIIEAATMLFHRHGVDDIAAARADISNLTRTTQAVRDAVSRARANGEHVVVFVTGIPGAGKTLCGLNLVFAAEKIGAAFLTGNLPLVHVLREALARDARRQGRSLRVARQEAESAIQPLLGFLRDTIDRTDPPHEHVIVFDEAQRAWDADFGRRKFGRSASEAALFLDIMHRHRDFAAIVALVGGGQEINTGEAGLAEWGAALANRPEWRVHAPSGALGGTDARQRLFASQPRTLVIDDALHLDVPVRSVRSNFGAPWVDAVLAGDSTRAAAIATQPPGVPFLLTRSLTAMRSILRNLARGSRRAGLVCSTGAKRLRADGLWPEFPHLDEKAVADWFLNRWPDVRASDALEVPATQFACQGLELDFVGLCWGGDLVRRTGRQAWVARAFKGTRWLETWAEASSAYTVNTYRVLLTRARYETVIWVPPGNAADATRDPQLLDDIAGFLLACGTRQLGPNCPPAPMGATLLL